ncbi:hypothetical protein [Streptomyces sp. NPDC008240]|uniref:hypothetical protein n=1 Tax=Streptomyces sp. NPDC008240 TaxID=3364822 RepID=UPI0036E5C94C
MDGLWAPRRTIDLERSTAKVGGRLPIAATVAYDVYDVAAAPSGPRTAIHDGVSLAGGLAGAGYGARFGTDLGSVGGPVGPVDGNLGGGVVGSGIGEGIVDGIEDLL